MKPEVMVPYELRVLLHYYSRTDDSEEMERNPPMWRQTIDRFKAEGLIVENTEPFPQRERCYSLTERGRFYCEALQRVPLPQPTWCVPATERLISTHDRQVDHG